MIDFVGISQDKKKVDIIMRAIDVHGNVMWSKVFPGDVWICWPRHVLYFFLVVSCKENEWY